MFGFALYLDKVVCTLGVPLSAFMITVAAIAIATGNDREQSGI